MNGLKIEAKKKMPSLEDYFPLLVLKGERFLESIPVVSFVAISSRRREEPKTLHVLIPNKLYGENKSIEDFHEEVRKSIQYVKSTTRIQPLNVKADIDQLVYLLQSSAGYVTIASPAGFEDFRFIRPPYERFDHPRKMRGNLSEELQLMPCALIDGL